ncbi:MAG: helix-turn-helix transcriptional regulator [Eubacteriales bacterium]|nr:helix-turn-helix transcriptional regulator [Eubacteriales bacterium]MDD4390572.1 helix-turn-helix transcriptional regulator [Eubacteriales bacterium]
MQNIKGLKIGEIISDLRRSKGITQDKLGEAVGVSSAAVSKWENGQSYPDILLLCDLAAFFDITTDELLGYEANISKEESNKLYEELLAAFAEKPVEEAVAECKHAIKKYINSDYLHLHIGNLLINHIDQSASPQTKTEMLELAKSLYLKVINKNADTWIVHQARYSLAVSYLFSGDGNAALSVSDDCVDTTLPPEILKAHALQLIGDKEKAEAVLQGYAFQCLVGLFNACPSLAISKMDNTEISVKWIEAVIKASEAFEMEKSNPLSTGQLFITYAHIMAIKNESDKALTALNRAAALLGNSSNYDKPFKEAGIFEDLSYINEKMDVGNKAPRSEKVIKESFISSLTQNPAFEGLKSHLEFKAIIEKFN